MGKVFYKTGIFVLWVLNRLMIFLEYVYIKSFLFLFVNVKKYILFNLVLE